MLKLQLMMVPFSVVDANSALENILTGQAD